MSTLKDWIDRANAFAEEVARLTVEAGVDGQVPARDLAMALAALDPSWWQLAKIFRRSSGFEEDVGEEEAKLDAIRAAVRAGEESGLAEGDVFADVRKRIGSSIHAIAMEVGGMDEINGEQNADRIPTHEMPLHSQPRPVFHLVYLPFSNSVLVFLSVLSRSIRGSG